MHIHSPRENIPQQPDCASLAQWRALTRQANAVFAGANPLDALRLYEEALQVALGLMAGPELAATPGHCLAALVVAHHNLSDVHRRGGNLAAALEHLCLPHDALTVIVMDPETPRQVRLAAVAHLRETGFALLHWQSCHGTCARTNALLRDGLAMPSLLDAGGHHC